MKSVVFGASLSAIVASAASADVTINFTNQTWFENTYSQAFAAGSLEGTLTGASINATLIASTSGHFVYASDLTIRVASVPTGWGGPLQCGGGSDYEADQRYYWPNGGSTTPGTTSIGTVNFTTGINLTGSTNGVWIGLNREMANDWGTWSGSVTLHGVNAVPAPGAMALLGLAGLASRRRRA